MTAFDDWHYTHQSFQLTRSRGAWQTWFYRHVRIQNFNSHAHVERDVGAQCPLEIKEISTHTLTWSVTRGVWKSLKTKSFQLTRSRGAWLGSVTEYAADKCISTHTLTWSVTIVETNAFISPKISTHTLTWSVTNVYQHIFTDRQISTHTLTWSVTGSRLAIQFDIAISTHTLTWSVTRYMGYDRGQQPISTHTLTWSVT